MTTSSPAIHTLAELLDQLGGVSPTRVRVQPPPGTATVADVIEIERTENRLCELVDGVLVEKVMGYRESLLAALLVTALRNFVDPRNLGLVSGADGMVHLFPALVRIPDVAFVSWSRLPGGVPEEPVPELVPDLAIEVVSKGNSKAEIERKVAEYFAAGVRLVWLVEPADRTVAVHVSPDRGTCLRSGTQLDGGDVLPGFSLPLATLFAELDRRPGPPPR